MSEKQNKNKFKQPEEIGKGFNDEHYQKIKEEISKRLIVSCRLTEDEGELLNVHLKDKQLTANKYLRELIKNDLDNNAEIKRDLENLKSQLIDGGYKSDSIIIETLNQIIIKSDKQ
jgi:hypothetical protein